MTILFRLFSGSVLACLAVMATRPGLAGDGFPFAVEERLRITNASGKDVAVTSAHTHRTTRIANQSAGVVPHGGGALTIKQRDGKAWSYKKVSPTDVEGTPYLIIKHYPIPFGGGTRTVNLLLHKDGRLYVLTPGAKDIEVGKLKQPKGFPLTPEEEIPGEKR